MAINNTVENINNQPTIEPQTVTGAFLRYIAKTIPLAFDESMSYYECICALRDYINQFIENLNNVNDGLGELQEFYLELQDYVNNYFDSLDVQEEINIKLDSMAADGSLTALIKNYVDPYIDIQNNQINVIRNEVDSINSKVNSVTSGSPAGVYDTVSDLTTADPDHSKIYVVTATGNWYYYDTTNTAWTSGGTYQASEINTGEIKTWQTEFYEDNNLYPKTNYITGKILNVNNGNETTWASGSYNPEYIEIDYTKTYIVINNSALTYLQPTFYTYDESKAYIGYVRPNANNKKYTVTFDEGVQYIRVSFWNINTPTLTAKTLFLTLEDALNLPSYEKIYNIKDIDFNTISTSDIVFPNEYGFRLLPYQEVATGNAYLTLNFPTIYEMKSTNSAVSGSNFIGVAFDYDTSKLTAGDTIYVDTTGSTNISNISLFATTSTTQNTLTLTNLGNGLYSGVITAELLSAMNSAKGVNNYYPRLMLIRTGQTAGTTLTTNMRVWINEDFTDFTKYLKDVIDILNESKTKETLTALVLGDSITALTGNRSWLTYFNEIQPIQVIQNVAVSGAWLMDKEGTIYDGNPVFNGPDNNVNNVLGNQVQKIINNSYEEPDIIMIAIGTNAGINCTLDDIYNSYYDSQGNLIPLEDVDRKTSAGAFRYCNETLRNLYPNSTVFWCSPIQTYYGSKKPNTVINWGTNLKNLCEFSSVQFIDTQDCGITAYTELPGANGLYLIDGLHPNANGAKYMGYYNATKVKEYCEAAKLFNE